MAVPVSSLMLSSSLPLLPVALSFLLSYCRRRRRRCCDRVCFSYWLSVLIPLVVATLVVVAVTVVVVVAVVVVGYCCMSCRPRRCC